MEWQTLRYTVVPLQILKSRTTYIQVWRSHHQVQCLRCLLAQPTDQSQICEDFLFHLSIHISHQECQNHSQKHKLWIKHLDNERHSNIYLTMCLAYMCTNMCADSQGHGPSVMTMLSRAESQEDVKPL